jgi:2-amino-4-hydroxy-6-hydroxymethyldihydropteridine diphosphokinase
MHHEVFVGIGSNVGSPAAQVRDAVGRLARLPGTAVVRVSSLYRTEPVGREEQDWFVNAVAQLESSLPPRQLMGELLAVEEEMGRMRTTPGGPRVIDLDILLFGDLVMDEAGLRIPHPRLHERRFVLVPLCEVAPHALHPVLKKETRELLAELKDTKCVEFLEPWRDG